MPRPTPEYQGAVHAGEALLDRATDSPEERKQLLESALDQPAVMRWDAVADHIVRNELADVVPPDPAHQQAARAQLVNQMAVAEWDGVQHRPNAGPLTADLTRAGVDRGVGQLREHYEQNPGEPYPAKVPNPAAALATQTEQGGEQQRTMSQAGSEPVPAARSRNSRPADRRAGSAAAGPAPSGRDQEMMRFLDNQPSAAQAVQQRPSLGDGARGAGAPAAAGVDRQTPGRGSSPTPRGRECPRRGYDPLTGDRFVAG